MKHGPVLYYHSELDEILQPLPICADNSATPKPLILDLRPGAISGLAHSTHRREEIAEPLQDSARGCRRARSRRGS